MAAENESKPSPLGAFPLSPQCARLKHIPDFNCLRLGTTHVDEIGKILPALFRKQIRRDEPRLIEILSPLWPRIVGRPMAEHSRPALFQAGVLTLAADSSTWSTQLAHLTEEIRAGVNAFLGVPVVKKLRVKTVGQPSLFAPPRPKAGAPATPIEGPPMDTTPIVDHEVAMALATSHAKYFSRPRR